jgi:hypothetical protein
MSPFWKYTLLLAVIGSVFALVLGTIITIFLALLGYRSELASGVLVSIACIFLAIHLAKRYELKAASAITGWFAAVFLEKATMILLTAAIG